MSIAFGELSAAASVVEVDRRAGWERLVNVSPMSSLPCGTLARVQGFDQGGSIKPCKVIKTTTME